MELYISQTGLKYYSTIFSVSAKLQTLRLNKVVSFDSFSS